MFWVFLASAIFGGAFLIPMLLGGLDSDVDFGGDVDLDVDLDMDVDLDADLDTSAVGDVGDTAAGGDALGAIFASLVSFRTVVFFAAFFGTSGLVFGALGYAATLTLVTAIVIGLVAAFANSALFGLIRNSQSNSQISDRTLEGRQAKVVLPIEPGHRGRIRIDLSGQPQYMVARPYDERSEQTFDVGAPVVVVRIENGTALVASLAELEQGGE